METVPEYSHTEAWEILKFQRANDHIIRVSDVHTLRKNNTEQNCTNHRTHLIKEQAGFRPVQSFTSQLLNITHNIQDGYQESMVTGICFVDQSAAKDTVNQRLLII